jgi:tetratricopeptide (TPR) repeat protein
VADRFACLADPPSSWRPSLPWWTWGLLLGVTVAVYANSLPNGFHYDDVAVVLQNPAVQRIERLPEHFWSITIGNQEGTPSYRPLVMVTYGLNYWLGGPNPVGYHAVNIGLHAAASVLVVLVMWSLIGRATPAFFAGAVFALHPIQTEAVNYITARSSLLYTLWSLIALWSFVRFRATGRGVALAGSAAAYAAALLAKEAAVAVPVLLVGYDVIVRRCGRRNLWGWVPPHLVFAGLTLAYLTLRAGMMAELMPPATHGNALTAGLTFAAVVAKTVSDQLAPIHLSIAHPFDPVHEIAARSLGAVALCLGFAAVAAFARRSASAVAYAALWFPVALLPVAALPLITKLALYQENRGYLSAVALCMVAGPLLAWCWESGEGRRVHSAARRIGVLVLFGVMALAVVSRNMDWRDGVRLWSHELSLRPNSQLAYVNLGGAYQARRDFPAAADVYRRALERYPENGLLHNNLGVVYRAGGDLDRAADEFRAAIRVRPMFALPYYNLGLILYDRGARHEALAAFVRFLELAPGQPGTGSNIQQAQLLVRELQGSVAGPGTDSGGAPRD